MNPYDTRSARSELAEYVANARVALCKAIPEDPATVAYLDEAQNGKELREALDNAYANLAYASRLLAR
jgi:hypothetical protein